MVILLVGVKDLSARCRLCTFLHALDSSSGGQSTEDDRLEDGSGRYKSSKISGLELFHLERVRCSRRWICSPVNVFGRMRGGAYWENEKKVAFYDRQKFRLPLLINGICPLICSNLYNT